MKTKDPKRIHWLWFVQKQWGQRAVNEVLSVKGKQRYWEIILGTKICPSALSFNKPQENSVGSVFSYWGKGECLLCMLYIFHYMIAHEHVTDIKEWSKLFLLFACLKCCQLVCYWFFHRTKRKNLS